MNSLDGFNAPVVPHYAGGPTALPLQANVAIRELDALSNNAGTTHAGVVVNAVKLKPAH
jgi:hypothetical protein